MMRNGSFHMATGHYNMPSPSPSELAPPYLRSSSGGLPRFGARSWGDDDSKSVASSSVHSASTNSLTRANREYSLLTKCVAEFLGDFTFVFVGTMQAFVTLGAADNIVHAALAHGFTIFILVASLGHISGGHFNPAVSWAVTALGKMPIYHFPCYMFAQLLGGFCGSLMSALLQQSRRAMPSPEPEIASTEEKAYYFEFNEKLNRTVMKVAIMTRSEIDSTYAGATLLFTGNKWWEGLISESVVTFFLVHTILLTAVDTDKNVLAPLAIGFTLSIDILATGQITGASMNPARSLGPNIVGQIFIHNLPPNFWNYHYIYWAGPFIGSTVAVIIHKMFEQREERLIR